MALLIDASLSKLPPFLVENGGVNSGFMIAQVTSAALASENKTLAHPASVDSLPTSANQEDHVSMAAFAGRRLTDMAENTNGGNLLKLASISNAILRSDKEPISAIASARLSAAIATGSAWKFPAEIKSPSLANTNGLSVTPFASTCNTSAAWRICVKQAPITCG